MVRRACVAAFGSRPAMMLHLKAEQAKPVPIVDEGGLQVLDEYFAWRRTVASRLPAILARRFTAYPAAARSRHGLLIL